MPKYLAFEQGSKIVEQINTAMKINFNFSNSYDNTNELIKLVDEFENLYQQMPSGWQNSVKIFFDAYLKLTHIDNNRITNIKYVNGVLRCITKHSTGPIRWMCDGFTKSISMQCMISPNERGSRRKAYTGSPCLSADNYVIYANMVEE